MSEQPEAISLLGQPLYASVARQGQDVAALEQRMAARKAEWEADPDDVQKYMLYVLANDALHNYRHGIELYTQGLERWPDEPMLYCHRGHRYLNIREFDRGLEDLQEALKRLPDSTDVWYHIGLAHYMKGEFEQALDAYQRCHAATNDDGDVPPTSSLKIVANAEIIRIGNVDWIYTTLCRLGRFDEAEAILETIDPNLQAGGNMIFYLTRVLFYKGILTEEETIARFREFGRGYHSMGYALGAWHLHRGNKEKARQYFSEAVQAPMWPAWAFIAAEAELARGL